MSSPKVGKEDITLTQLSLLDLLTPKSEKQYFTPGFLAALKKPTSRCQVQFLKSHYPNAELITDIGSGLNFKRKGLQALLESVLSDDVGLVVVAHKDRLCRFGFDLISWLASRSKTEILVLNKAHLSPETEMVEDILAIIHVFSCRLLALRKYKKQIREDSELPSVSMQGVGDNLEAVGRRSTHKYTTSRLPILMSIKASLR